MGRVLALDWGRVRIGAAISDEDKKIAFALDQFFEANTAITELVRFVSERGVEKIVVGNPLSLRGEEEQSSREAQSFIERLSKKIPTPIEMVDERFSSLAAQKILTQEGVSQKKQRLEKDNLAAQLMLQQYLDTKNH